MLPYECCRTDRFAEFASTATARAVWTSVSSREAVESMKAASAEGKAAVLPLVDTIRERLLPDARNEGIDEEGFKSMCLGMVRQVMEYYGYTHVACALIPGGYFTSAGIFGKSNA